MPSPPLASSPPSQTYASSLHDPDSASILSETSTLQSKSNLFDAGYGFSAPSLTVDNAYLNEKRLPLVPTPESGGLRRSRSPNHKGAHPRSPHPSPPTHRYRSPGRSASKPQIDLLAEVVGPDSIPHTTELDSVPCAGIRIPAGPFSGLLAWRLVVGVHPLIQGQRSTNRKREFALLPKTDIRHAGNMPRGTHPPPRSAGKAVVMNPDDSPPLNNGNRDVGDSPHMVETRKYRRVSLDASATLSGRRNGRVFGHGRSASELQAPAPFYAKTATGRSSMDSVASMPPVVGAGNRTVDGSGNGEECEDGGWDLLPSSSTPALTAPYSSSRASQSSSRMPSGATPPQGDLSPSEAVVTNFLLDTSLGHNTISRETLSALGFSPAIIDGLEASEAAMIFQTRHQEATWSEMAEVTHSASHPQERSGPSSVFSPSAGPKTLSLYLQDVAKPITFRLAPPGEPSRLGVQFLLDSDVHVCMAEGGRGGILWADKAEKRLLLQNVPRTVPLPKLSLQARVKALFGL